MLCFKILKPLCSLLLLPCLLLLAAPSLTCAQESTPQEPFLPLWKLLSSEQKQYFISGYLKGLSDASRVTEVAIEYVRQNPSSAVQGLAELRKLYDFSHLSGIEAVRQIELYYADPENKDRAFLQAITAGRTKHLK